MIPVILHITLPSGRTRRVDTSLPDGWSGVKDTSKALRALAEFPGAHGQCLALRYVLKLKATDFFCLSNEQAADLLRVAPWLKLSPSPTPLLGNVRWRRKLLCWPAAKFANGTLREFAIADAAFEAYQDAHPQALEMLTATLLRPRKTRRSFHFARVADSRQIERTGDERVAIVSRAELESQAQRLADKPLPSEVKAAVLMYWIGIKEYVHQAYGSYLFEDPEAEQTSGPVAKGPDFGWHGQAMEIAKEGALGTLEQVYDTNFHTVAMYLVKRNADRRAEQEASRQRRATA